jgi:hypothetical protein
VSRDQLEREGGSLYGWRRGWPPPAIQSDLHGSLTYDLAPPPALLAKLANLPESEVLRRLDQENRAFLLLVDGRPAAYGWSAAGPADIGGLSLSFTVPPGERYLWDFVTLPSYRGRALYPLLIQKIVQTQANVAEWFWIGHEPHNDASKRGILKAGFKLAGEFHRLRGGHAVLVRAPEADQELAERAARALGVKLHVPRSTFQVPR